MRKNRGYIDYDYEAAFTDPIDYSNESNIEKLLQQGKVKSVYTTKTIKAGNQFEVEIYPSFTKKESTGMNLKPRSSTAQKNLNDKNARKKLERLINANFSNGDLWVTLTYDNEHLPESMKDALKNIGNYMRRINYRREKMGLSNAKYIYITEYNPKKKIRCHHHLIMDGALSMDLVEKMWKFGKRNNVRRTQEDEDGGLMGLAKYLVKDPAGSKRWCSSKNLKKPVESKSYHAFRSRQVRKMVENRECVKELLEKRYKNRSLINFEIKKNEINGYFYVYARMTERRNQ